MQWFDRYSRFSFYLNNSKIMNTHFNKIFYIKSHTTRLFAVHTCLANI
jgi:hypothetical protein